MPFCARQGEREKQRRTKIKRRCGYGPFGCLGREQAATWHAFTLKSHGILCTCMHEWIEDIHVHIHTWLSVTVSLSLCFWSLQPHVCRCYKRGCRALRSTNSYLSLKWKFSPRDFSDGFCFFFCGKKQRVYVWCGGSVEIEREIG